MTAPDALVRQRAAALAVWRVDADSRPAGEWAELGGLQVHTTGLAPRFWNGALLHDRGGLDRIPDAAAWFAVRDKPWGLLAPVELDITPPGFAHVDDQRVMLRDLDGLPGLPDLALTWDPALEDVVALHVEAFDDPPGPSRDFTGARLANPACLTVVAAVDGTPAATATGVQVDGVVGVFGVATAAAYRRRGLGSAVTLAVLHRARERGADLAYLNSSDLGYGAYRALGFVDAPPWQVWLPSGRPEGRP